MCSSHRAGCEQEVPEQGRAQKQYPHGGRGKRKDPAWLMENAALLQAQHLGELAESPP